MNRLLQLAVESDIASYDEGAEDGFWRGYMVGAEACRRFIAGETNVNPAAPSQFGPLGKRYYPRNFAE